MKLIKIYFASLFLLLAQTIIAQHTLTADSVVQLALKNNFDILVAMNEATINQVNNTAGNAGMLPTLSGNASDNYSVNNIHQKQSSGSEVRYNSASTNTASASLELNWTVFDGGKMFISRSKLAEMETMGELQFKEKVQQVVYDVLAAYFTVVKQKQQLASVLKAMSYNEERVKLLQASYNTGLSPKNTLLQAQIDLNVNRESAITQQNVIVQAKRSLNQLLALDAEWLDYEVEDSITVQYNPNKADLVKQMEASNASLLAMQKQIDVAQLTLKETKTLYYPKISLNAGYYFSQTDNKKGSVLFNQSIGPMIGGTISIPLYQAGDAKRQVNVAQLQVSSAEYAMANLKIQLSTQLTNALNEFENQRQLLEIETTNKNLATENLEIALQRLRLGQTTPLEVRQAQQSYEEALTRFTNFSYNLKMAETKLRQLVSQL
jgi:outer membrane protein